MRNLFGLLLVLCFAAVAPAQERVLDKSEFDSMVVSGGNHRRIWKGEKYRMTVTTSSKAIDRPLTDWSSKMIFEYGPAGETRTITSSNFGDKVRPTNEVLRLGSWIYSRVDNGPWSKKAYVAAEPAKRETERPFETLTSTTEYKYLGPGNLTGKSVQLYTKIEKQTRVNKQSGETIESVVKLTYWIDEDGTIIKNEYASENRGPRVTSQTVITTKWEADPSISFAVPEVGP